MYLHKVATNLESGTVEPYRTVCNNVQIEPNQPYCSPEADFALPSATHLAKRSQESCRPSSEGWRNRQGHAKKQKSMTLWTCGWICLTVLPQASDRVCRSRSSSSSGASMCSCSCFGPLSDCFTFSTFNASSQLLKATGRCRAGFMKLSVELCEDQPLTHCPAFFSPPQSGRSRVCCTNPGPRVFSKIIPTTVQ